MASFDASPASRAARAACYNAPHHVGHVRSTLKGNDTIQGVEADIAALKKASLADAGPIVLRLLQCFEFREYARINRMRPAGIPDCIYTYMHNGVLIVDTPTRSASPSPDTDTSNWMQRGCHAGGVISSVSTQSTLCGSFDLEMDMLAYLNGFATSESIYGINDPLVLFAEDRKPSSSLSPKLRECSREGVGFHPDLQ